MKYEELRQELKSYYKTHSFHAVKDDLPYNPLKNIMNAYFDSHPGMSPLEQKAAQYELIAEHFTPVLFRNSPFFSETGLKISEYDGHTSLSSGGYVYCRNAHLFRDVSPAEYDHYTACGSLALHLAYGPYCDPDHHCFPFTNVLEQGLEGIYRKVITKGKSDFYSAAARGLLAVKRIAERFAEAAEAQNLPEIARIARRIPWNPAETFYEGLACIWFLHQIGGVLDGIGMSVIGHPDRMLASLYQNDIASKRITAEEAYDLICRFMFHTDCKLDLDSPVNSQFNGGEQGDTLILGGCDADGKPVCNDLTFMFLRAHRELKLIYPKIHCRISHASSQKFLEAASEDFFNGRNVISFLNDDGIIPAQVKAGKTLADARRYVAGGCWEIIVEGSEHSEGANCYFNLARIVDLSIHDAGEFEAGTGEHFDKLISADDFETVYSILIGNVIRSIKRMCGLIRKNGSVWSRVNPSPFFSACLDGCLESGRDYTEGGARYSPHGIPLGGLAILVDSLLSVKNLCFERKICSFETLLAAVRADWNGYEPLRKAALNSPHFGDNCGDSAALAKRILSDIADAIMPLKNERGGPFQPGIYIYHEIVWWADRTRATPDGRRLGDFLTQGLTPSRSHASNGITSVINSCAEIDLSRFPANSVLTLSVQKNGMTPQIFAALLRGFIESKAGMLQLNVVDRAELEDACVHPERHQDLIVRLYGYSAKFVTLDEKRRAEFLSRQIN